MILFFQASKKEEKLINELIKEYLYTESIIKFQNILRELDSENIEDISKFLNIKIDQSIINNYDILKQIEQERKTELTNKIIQLKLNQNNIMIKTENDIQYILNIGNFLFFLILVLNTDFIILLVNKDLFNANKDYNHKFEIIVDILTYIKKLLENKSLIKKILIQNIQNILNNPEVNKQLYEIEQDFYFKYFIILWGSRINLYIYFFQFAYRHLKSTILFKIYLYIKKLFIFFKTIIIKIFKSLLFVINIIIKKLDKKHQKQFYAFFQKFSTKHSKEEKNFKDHVRKNTQLTSAQNQKLKIINQIRRKYNKLKSF